MLTKRLGILTLIVLVAGATAACSVPAEGATRRRPVIFVHGYLGSSHYWTTQMRQFQSEGYRSEDLHAITYDYNASVVDTAPALAREVDAVRARTGATQVDIVSYSLGSLVTKQCIIGKSPQGRPDCRGKVARWMSIAGVQNGTSVELPTAVGTASNEDVQGRTPVIEDLQRRWDVLVKQGVAVEVQWSPLDLIVVPAENSTEPPPAINKQVSPLLNHLTIALDPGVIYESIRFFAQR